MGFVERIIERILEAEGAKYTNDPRDAGGPTKYGITQRALSEWRGKQVTPDDVRFLMMDEAAKIYRARYFTGPGFDKVAAISEPVAAELMDTGVNIGPQAAITFLQRALNAFTDGARYHTMDTDGRIGPATLAALQSFINWRGSAGEAVMVRTLNCLQGTRYVELTESNPRNRSFAFGWILNRVMA